MPIQLQICAILLAFAFMGLTVYLIRTEHAEVRQMNKWLILACILLIGALFPKLAMKVANLFGIINLTSLALFGLTAILLVFALLSTIEMIKVERQLKVLTQELSLLKKEVKDKEHEEK